MLAPGIPTEPRPPHNALSGNGSMLIMWVQPCAIDQYRAGFSSTEYHNNFHLNTVIGIDTEIDLKGLGVLVEWATIGKSRKARSPLRDCALHRAALAARSVGGRMICTAGDLVVDGAALRPRRVHGVSVPSFFPPALSAGAPQGACRRAVARAARAGLMHLRGGQET